MSDNDATSVRCGNCGTVYDTGEPRNMDDNGTPQCPACEMPVTLPSTKHVTRQ